MKLSKYFLSAFAFIAAIGGSIASTSFDYIQTASGRILEIEERQNCQVQPGPTCRTNLTGVLETVYDSLTMGGTNVDFTTRKAFN